MEALAPHLAVVVAAQRLTADLSRERERVTVATLTERDRLRRDLHDGLGPSLSGIALGLEAADKELTGTRRRPGRCSTAPGRRRSRRCARSDGCSTGCGRGRSTSTDSTARCGRRRSAMGMNEPGRPRLPIDIDPLPVLSAVVEESAYRISAESHRPTWPATRAPALREIRQVDGTLVLGVEDDGEGCDPVAVVATVSSRCAAAPSTSAAGSPSLTPSPPVLGSPPCFRWRHREPGASMARSGSGSRTSRGVSSCRAAVRTPTFMNRGSKGVITRAS